jgi:hypothetical protein
MYRHISKGAWTFSMQDHGWQVSDCTAEGLKVIKLHDHNYIFSRFVTKENLKFGKTFSFVGCNLVLTNASGPCWGKNGGKSVLWCCECHSFTTSKNSTFKLFLTQLAIKAFFFWHKIFFGKILFRWPRKINFTWRKIIYASHLCKSFFAALLHPRTSTCEWPLMLSTCPNICSDR